MALQVADRVKETSTTTGTGTVTLSGAQTGYVAFTSAITTGNTTYYCIQNQAVPSEWEVGLGTLATGTTLARTTILASSNSGSAVPFSAGTKDVFVTLPASADLTRVGTIIQSAAIIGPTGYLACDGTAQLRTTYANLFNVLVQTSTITATIASPCSVTWTANGLPLATPVVFSTTGTLPAGITAGTTYYVTSSSPPNLFGLSATPGGTQINTTGTQSGVHTATVAPWGTGNGTTTFTLPDLRGSAPVGTGYNGGTSLTYRTIGTSGGEETHILSIAEMPAHTHPLSNPQGTSGGGYGLVDSATANSSGVHITASTGGGGSHNNMMPWVAVSFWIKY